MKAEKRKANVKLLFKGQKLDCIEFGDFGMIEKPEATKPKKEIPCTDWEDCLIAWPTEPELTGKSGIAEILQLPITDRFFRSL